MAWDLLYSHDVVTLETMIILVSRKLTIILYEISLSCKYFIHNRTFRNFK